MPSKEPVQDLNSNSVQILNTIRSNASPEYRAAVPVANASVESIREIGKIILNYPLAQNEFLNALVNRIGRVIITSKLYSNPWAGFKKGLLEYGETIEEIFVNIARPYEYQPDECGETVFKCEIPDVRAAFHIMNYRKFYPATIKNDQLRTAFLSWDGITDLIARIVDSMYTGANYDEFLTMKYLLGRSVLNGYLHAVSIPNVETANMKEIVSTVKGISNLLEFESKDYNYSGVYNFTRKEDQFVILNAKFDAVMDVEVLASAFNMDRAQFMGNRVLVDSFGTLDQARLAQLFAEDPNYKPFTQAEIEALDAIPAMIVDRDFFMIFDNFYNFTEIYNPKNLYWNYFYHVWKTFSISPFANAVVMLPGGQTVTTVSVQPGAATLNTIGDSVQLSATVSGTNFPSQEVTFVPSGAGATYLTVNQTGKNTATVTYSSPVTAQITYQVNVTSTLDPTKSTLANITLNPPA